ncbi:MAG: ATP-binding protein, partial [Bdellovibrio sp.]
MTKNNFPWWTWLLPLAALVVATLASLPFTTPEGLYWIYFPVNLGTIMALWWGPRVLVPVYLNGLLAAALLNLPHPWLYPLYAFPETLQVFLAWVLVRERFKDMPNWHPNPMNISLFCIYGLVIPSVFCALLAQALYVVTGVIDRSSFFWTSLVGTVGDLTGATFVGLPILILASPWLYKKNLSSFAHNSLPPLQWSAISHKEKLMGVAVLGGLMVMGVSLPLSQTWYIYGILLLLASAWYGLYASLILNTWIMTLTVALPKLMHLPWADDPLTIQTPATLLTLSFCALVAGSAVSSLTEKVFRLKETEGQLKVAKEQAEEASQAKSDFLARMSHEIRTPLNSVLGMLELLKETQLSKDQERYISLFSHAGENLKALINDLLDFSKIEAKALSIENVSYNLHTTIRSVFEILQIKAEEKGLQFILNMSNEVPAFQWGDPTRLRQVLFNLIGNALKFTTEGTVSVNVRLRKDDGQKLLIEVQDTGIGIPRDKQGQLFSPFFQADPGINRKYGGTGLGLVISKNLVEIMGGYMQMKSLSGRGTTFTIILPHKPDLGSAQEKKSAPAHSWNFNKVQSRFRVLLVDDSEDNRVLMIHYLKDLPFECIEATNGQEAVDKFKESPFDLIFMDMQMPIMTGYKATEFIRHIEEERDQAHTPIIALTATAVIEDLQRALSSGCDSYAVKPVKKSEIVEILARSLAVPE